MLALSGHSLQLRFETSTCSPVVALRPSQSSVCECRLIFSKRGVVLSKAELEDEVEVAEAP